MDSLTGIWKNPSQSVEVRLKWMTRCCDEILLRSDPDSAYRVASSMLDLARTGGNKLYKAEALRIQGESVHYRGEITKAKTLFEESLQVSIQENHIPGMAKAYNNIGNILAEQGVYTKSLEYYKKSLALSEQISNKTLMANTTIAMGIIYYDQGNALISLKLFEQALDMISKTDDVRVIGRINNNIGVIYHEQGNYNLAMEYFNRALNLFERISEKRGMASSLNNIGDLYASQNNFDEALAYNFQSLEIRELLDDKRGMANCYNVIGDNYNEQGNQTEALKYYIMSAEIREKLGEKRAMSRVYGNIGNLFLEQDNYNEGTNWCTKAKELSMEIGAKMEEKDACLCLYKAFKALEQPKLALTYFERAADIEQELKVEETARTLQKFEFKKIILQDSLRKEKEKLIIEQRHREEVSQKNKQRNIFLFSGLAVLAMAGGLFSRLRYIRKSRAIIQKEKDRSDKLLLNILPAETAEELKIHGAVKAQQFDMATVMFTDFKGFTFMSEKLSAQELVSEIDFCFKAFDEIILKHKLEKIKTIGDAYMCAGGLPVANTTNPIDVVRAAIDIRDFMLNLKQKRQAEDNEYLEVRIGIHSGPVIAGVVGTCKFQYDIWGDTVNTAARMESSGEVGQVNISQNTFDLVKEHFNCTHRGKIKAKNKGSIDMYFVNQ